MYVREVKSNWHKHTNQSQVLPATATNLRGYRSAIWPARSAKISIGAACTRPTIPRVTGSCVRAYNSHPTTTLCIESPTPAMFRPIVNSRYCGIRRAAYESRVWVATGSDWLEFIVSVYQNRAGTAGVIYQQYLVNNIY